MILSNYLVRQSLMLSSLFVIFEVIDFKTLVSTRTPMLNDIEGQTRKTPEMHLVGGKARRGTD